MSAARFGIVAIAMLVAITAACGDDVESATPESKSPSDIAPGDATLARARASIANGRIDPAIVDELRRSDDPAHARARRLLDAMAGEGGSLDPDHADANPDVPARIVAPAPTSADDVATIPEPSAVASSEPSRPQRPRSASRRELAALHMTASDGGATLIIKAPGAVTVGVANQLSSGLVHLVIEGATASPKVIGARPNVRGAAVTRVRKGEGSVQITLQLDPGWKLDRVDSFTGGAKVKLRGPK